jgi:hypothetical protein
MTKNKDSLDALLALIPNTEGIEVELPSRGKFYNLPDPSKSVMVRALNFEDEKIVSEAIDDGRDAQHETLLRCVSNVKHAELLLIDYLWLFVKIRELSYGKEHITGIACPGCKNKAEVTINTSDFPMIQLPEDFEDPREIKLPVTGILAKVRLPREKDANYLRDSKSILGNLWRFVESFNGNSNNKDLATVISKLPVKDAHILLDAIATRDYGLITKFNFVCHKCKAKELMEIDLSPDFFSGK